MRDDHPLKASVLTVTRDRAHFLKDFLESLAAQTYPHWEAVVVDNASTDGTAELLGDFQKRFPGKVQHIRLPENIGFPRGIERAAQAATGELIAFMGDDDMLMPEMLEEEVREFRRNPALALVCANAWSGERPFAATVFPADYPGVRDRALSIEEFIGLDVALICTQTALFRKEAFRAVGGFDLEFPDYQDVDLFFRLSTRFPLCYIPKPLAFFRIHPGSFSNANREKLGRSASACWRRKYELAADPKTKALFLRALCKEELQQIYFYLSDDARFDYGLFREHVRRLWSLKKLHGDWRPWYFGLIALLPVWAYRPLRSLKRLIRGRI